jgi:hypothetical protein
MALNALQQSRVAFHLDFVSPSNLLALDRDIATILLSPEQELAVVGQDPAPVGSELEFEGEYLCTTTSALGRVETAYRQLSPDVIGDSLLVKQAGKVTLRSDELSARQALYNRQVEQLAQLIGAAKMGVERVGFVSECF